MAKIIFENLNQEYDIEDNSLIIEPCEKAGVVFACGYAGICGSCIVEVIEGMENLCEFTEEEKNLLDPNENKRLACKCTIKSGTVKLTF